MEYINYEMNTSEDIRDYVLLENINRILQSMSATELKTANLIIKSIAQHLDNKYFNEKATIDIKALVKTFGELDDIGMEILHNNQD